MKKKQKHLQRLSLIEIFVIVSIGLLLVFIGWLVYENQFNKNVAPAISQQVEYTYTTDSSGSFSFGYPNHWQIQPYIWEDCCGPQDEEPDWTKESKPITLELVEDKDVTISINAIKYGDYWLSFDDLKARVEEDFFAKKIFEGERADGHNAIFARVDYLGPPDAKVESFTDHRYYFDNGTYVLVVEFREKYHHDWPDDEARPDIDNSKHVADFEYIANSINFLRKQQ